MKCEFVISLLELLVAIVTLAVDILDNHKKRK